MLILSNDDVDRLLSMKDCIDVFETAYREASTGAAVDGRRSDMITRTRRPDGVYSLKMVGGVVPSLEVGAVRINSDILTFPTAGGRTQKVKIPAAAGDRWVGLVLLFDTATGEPLALFPDGVIQRIRVGATSGLGVRHLARADARTVALFGSGWQAGAQAMAVAAVRPVETIRVFSPNPDNRARFAAETERRLQIEVRPAASPAEAAKGADIVLCATNSLQAVFDGVGLEPGTHLGSIRDGELDPAVLERTDTVVVHHPGNMASDHLVVAEGIAHKEGSKQVNTDPRLAFITAAPSLADLVAGKTAGRARETDVTCFLNYHGLGYQFAAAGAALLERARAEEAGHSLPADWFTQDVHS